MGVSSKKTGGEEDAGDGGVELPLPARGGERAEKNDIFRQANLSM